MKIDFTVVEHPTISCFEMLVNKLLKEGWQFHGTMLAVSYPTSTHPVTFIQAMYKVLEVV